VLSARQWDQLMRVLSGKALFVAKLVAGAMPGDVEGVFRQANLSLFPEKRGDLHTDGSCPDQANPCKHIAAVYYLLGEEFDHDPFLVFRLRGLGREDLLARLGGAGGAGGAAAHGSAEAAPAAPPEPLPAKPQAFWSAGEMPDDLCDEVQAPPASAGWLRRLGKSPFWRGNQPLLEALEPTYVGAADAGLNKFIGERGKAAGKESQTTSAGGGGRAGSISDRSLAGTSGR
jgi:uncharacterized Zn finger protein